MENRWICMTPRSRLTHTILYKLSPGIYQYSTVLILIYYLGIAIRKVRLHLRGNSKKVKRKIKENVGFVFLYR